MQPIVFIDANGALHIEFQGKVIIGNGQNAQSPQLVIDTLTGITDIGGEGSDNFIRIIPSQGAVPAQMQICSGGHVRVTADSMSLPCPNFEPADEKLQGSDIVFFADEEAKRIRFKFKDSNSVVHVNDVGAYEV